MNNAVKRIVSAVLLCALAASLCLLCGCNTGPKVQIIFDLRNGEDNIVLEVNQFGTIKNAPTPSRRGCKFVGWVYNKQVWNLKKDKVEGPMTLYAKWALADDAFDKDPNAGVKSEGTDLRVCSFNLLKGEMSAIGNRPKYLVNVLETYQMDIVAVQEFDVDWKSNLKKLIEGTCYSLLCDSADRIGGIGTPDDLIYRNDKLTVIESGCYQYVTATNYKSNLAWAIFETKDETKQRFLALSLHWNYADQECRNLQSALVSSWVNEMRAKHGNIPVISMGDYNEYENEPPCEDYLKNTSMLDSKYEAVRKGLLASSYHQHPTADSYTVDKLSTVLTIDHIFYTQEISALYYDTIIWEVALMTSDHNAVYADLKFK